MKIFTFATTIAAGFAGTALAQNPAAPEKSGAAAPSPTAEETAAATLDRAYEAAFAKGDAKAVADLFTEDAEFTSDEGRTVSGRAAIEAMSKASFQSNKGSKLTIESGSVRLLAPGVAVEKGSTTVTGKDGDTSSALYTAVLVQKDGKWKISEVTETPHAEVSPGGRLAELAWLVGDWQEVDKSSGQTIRSKFDWAKGGNFLTRNVTVKQGDEVSLEGWQIIGWDPLEERIRSWTFDSEGGWSEGFWVRDGKRWLAREEGVTPDGDRTSVDNTISQLSDDKLTWEAGNRTLNGSPQPSMDKIEIIRVKGE